MTWKTRREPLRGSGSCVLFRVRTLRRALALTQEEFAERYHIPLATLRDWEQGRSEPDQPAKAYLTVIARDPEGVERALHSCARLISRGADARRLRLR